MIEHPDVLDESNEGFLRGGYGGRCRHFPKREPDFVPTPDALSRFSKGVIVEVGDRGSERFHVFPVRFHNR